MSSKGDTGAHSGRGRRKSVKVRRKSSAASRTTSRDRPRTVPRNWGEEVISGLEADLRGIAAQVGSLDISLKKAKAEKRKLAADLAEVRGFLEKGPKQAKKGWKAKKDLKAKEARLLKSIGDVEKRMVGYARDLGTSKALLASKERELRGWERKMTKALAAQQRRISETRRTIDGMSQAAK